MEISVKESNLSKFVFSILILVYHICIWGYDCTNRWFTFVCGVAMFGFLFCPDMVLWYLTIKMEWITFGIRNL